MGIIGILVLILLLIGVPIGAAFWLPSVFGASTIGLEPEMIAANVPYQTAIGFSLLAIPYFILAGQIMSDGGLVRHIVALAQLALGKLKGAVGYVVIGASALFGATTGSSVATVATISASMGEEMVKRGYKRDYVASLIASAGLLGVLLPPSIPMIIFASVVGESVGELFLAILIPGVIFIVGFMLMHRYYAKRGLRSPEESDSDPGTMSLRIDEKEKGGRWGVLLRAIAPLMMPVIMLGGIYSGIFTPTEAAAAGAVYGLTLALLTRGLKFKMLPGTFLRAAVPAAAILIIMSLASSFNRVLTIERVPQTIAEFATNAITSQAVFLVVLLLISFLVGMFMETNAAILIMAPLLYPTAMMFDVNPIHFGVILVTTLEIGMITPPLAVNIFVAAKSNGASVVRMMPYVLRFILMSAVLMVVITFVPWLTTWHL